MEPKLIHNGFKSIRRCKQSPLLRNNQFNLYLKNKKQDSSLFLICRDYEFLKLSLWGPQKFRLRPKTQRQLFFIFVFLRFWQVTLVDSIVKWTSDDLKDKETTQYLYEEKSYFTKTHPTYFELFDVIYVWFHIKFLSFGFW